MAKAIFWLCVSILLNGFGNAVTVKAALGSAPWTAAGLNFSNMFGITVGNALIIMSLIVMIADDCLRRRWNRMKDVYNFIYVLSFGYVIDAWLFVMQGITLHGFALRLVSCLFGVICIAAALSIYLRLNLVLHPFDDLLNILREKYLKGNVVLAQRISLGIPLAIGLSVGLVRHEIIGISIGTLFSFLCMGYFILLFDKMIPLRLHERWLPRFSHSRHGHVSSVRRIL